MAALSSIWRVGLDPSPKHERPYWTLINNSSDEAERQAQGDDNDGDDFAPMILSSNDNGAVIKDSRHQKEDDETARDDDDDDDDENDKSTNTTKDKLASAPTTTSGGNQPGRLPCSRLYRLFVVMSAVLLLLYAVIFMTKKYAITGGSRTNEASLKANKSSSSSSSLPQYLCPESPMQKSSPEFNPDEPALYMGQDATILANITAFIEQYQDIEFDQWGSTWRDFKEGRSDFIARRFGPNLKSGSSIYESACGIGLNLALTLEVLSESPLGITDLVVYGNDFVQDSIVVANALLAEGAGILPANGHVGRLCHGDSMDLSHVPSNAFDLVFTGYVTPLQNPLELNLGSSTETRHYYKHEICTSPQRKHAAAFMQEKQDAWWGAWISEMIRLAKPGVPIIVEGVSQPLCVELEDWGGVGVEFWYSGVEKYGWDIDVESIEIEPDLMNTSRYHVFMRKSNTAEP